MPTIVLLGTLDTKGPEYAYLHERVSASGCNVLLVDAGVLGPRGCTSDIPATELAHAAGAELSALAAAADRGKAVATMARGAAHVVRQLYEAGRCQGVLTVGGSGNATIAAAAMQALPIGVPKLIVSTMAAGDTRPYIGATDIAMLYSVVDIAGINRVSATILNNAASAIAGMAHGYTQFTPPADERPVIAASMFGVTTPCVNTAREQLDAAGYEVLVFHATGSGGRSLEALVAAGLVAGVLDVTTTEWADELVGGVLSAGPDRLTAAGQRGVPQAISLGALDMVNFGPFESVPQQFNGRTFYRHNASVTLMRTTPTECAQLGTIIAEKLNAATGPTALFVPLRGISMIAEAGQPFHDPQADAALFTALRATLAAHVELHELDLPINDPAFAQAMASWLTEQIACQNQQREGP